MLGYLDRMIAEGFGKAVTVGAFSTGIVGGGAGTVLDLDQPELAIAVPAGVVLRPIYFEVSVQSGITTADDDEAEVVIGVDSLGLWTGDGTKTDETPSNMNTSFDAGSMCKVGSAFTADMTTTPNGGSAADPVMDIELARDSLTFNFGDATGISGHQLKVVYQPALPEWIVGPATVLVYWGGTIATVGGFADLRWVEAQVQSMKTYAGYN